MALAVGPEPRLIGPRLCFYDVDTAEELGWFDSSTKTTAYKPALGARYISLGFRGSLNAGSAAVLAALAPTIGGTPVESPNDSLYPDDVDPLVDGDLNTWAIDSSGRVTLNAGVSAQGPALFLWYHNDVVSYLSTSGDWFSHLSGVWTNVGPVQPGMSFTPSADWALVDAPGESIVDDVGATWSLGSVGGAGYNGQRNGTNYNGMWCVKIKLGDASHVDGNGDRRVYHQNPLNGLWLYEISPTTWSGFIVDPQSGTPPVGNGVVQTRGTITSGVGMNKITLEQDIVPAGLLSQSLAYLIICTGGTASFHGRASGQRGTVDVGGCWPTGTSGSGSGGRYANEAAVMAAAGSWTTGDHVWAEDTGQVYFHTGSGFQNKNTISGEDTTRMAQPRALCVRVTGKAGLVMTLSGSALVETTSALVYLDIAVVVQAAVTAASNGTNSDDGGSLAATTGLGDPFNEAHVTYSVIDIDQIIIDAVGQLVDMAWGGLVVVSSKRYVKLVSTVRLIHPPGAPNQTVEFRSCKGCRWKGKIDGNFSPATDQHMSWGGTTGNGNFNNGGAQNIISGFQEGSNQVFFYLSTGCVAYDASGTNALSCPVGGYVSFACRVYRHRYDQGPPTTQYTWHFQFQVSDDCHFVDCQVYSDHLIGGAEHFVSGGTSPNHHIRWRGRNFLIAVNDGGNRFWIGEDPNNPGLGGHVVEFTAGCLTQPELYPGWTYINQFNPAIHISAAQSSTNVNLGGICPNDYCGRVRNVRITVSGYGNSRKDCTGGFRTATPCRDIFMENIKYFGQNWVSGCFYGGSNGAECNGLRSTFRDWEVRGLSSGQATNRNIFANTQAINLGNIAVDDPTGPFIF